MCTGQLLAAVSSTFYCLYFYSRRREATVCRPAKLPDHA